MRKESPQVTIINQLVRQKLGGDFSKKIMDQVIGKIGPSQEMQTVLQVKI